MLEEEKTKKLIVPHLFTSRGIEHIEDKRKCKYIGCYSHKNNDNLPCEVFFREDFTHPVSNSKFFCLFYDHKTDKHMISAWYPEWCESTCFKSKDNKYFIRSRFRHDYFAYPETNQFIDGGTAYTRCLLDEKLFNHTVGEDGLHYIDNELVTSEIKRYEHICA